MPHSILNNAAIASGGRVINVAFGILATALITRFLGPGGFGLYILILSFGAIVQLVADFGLYLTLTREVAKHPTSQLLSQVMSLRLALLTGAFLLGAVLTRFLTSFQGVTIAFLIIAVGLAAQSLSQLLMGLFQHYQSIWRATVGDLVGRLAQIIVIGLIGVTAASVNTMAAAFTIGAIAAFLVHQWLLPQLRWRLSISWPAWRRLIITSWPLGAMLLLNAVFFRVDAVVLSLFRSSTEVGYYGLAYRIIESALFFPAMLGGLLLPRISESLRDNRLQARRYLTEGLRLLIVAASFLLLIIYSASSTILTIIGGPPFTAAAPLLGILGLAATTIFIGNLFGFTLVALDRPYALLKLYLVLAIANLAANFIFIPVYGATAAAWTTVATELASTITAGIIVHRHLPVHWPQRTIIVTIVITLVAVIAIRVLPDHSSELLSVSLASGIFLAGHLISRTLSPSQLPLLRGVK